jgi:hypothetical protein
MKQAGLQVALFGTEAVVHDSRYDVMFFIDSDVQISQS